eukprot:gnl/TRDRNA2_/TRDRNA2_28955_c0_seq2.p1 gnl/TRDRNA2_/TRDRNA2_28955_c0~~gnl/TRDRNA2_/TRDRNA2_28955_c0_seq2.p1  ORF type:complete len:459 (-),score=58.26 gnl/TRDRNA2_/TRDRNA2_28955_c0_seq2:44-1420(-)
MWSSVARAGPPVLPHTSISSIQQPGGGYQTLLLRPLAATTGPQTCTAAPSAIWHMAAYGPAQHRHVQRTRAAPPERVEVTVSDDFIGNRAPSYSARRVRVQPPLGWTPEEVSGDYPWDDVRVMTREDSSDSIHSLVVQVPPSLHKCAEKRNLHDFEEELALLTPKQMLRFASEQKATKKTSEQIEELAAKCRAMIMYHQRAKMIKRDKMLEISDECPSFTTRSASSTPGLSKPSVDSDSVISPSWMRARHFKQSFEEASTSSGELFADGTDAWNHEPDPESNPSCILFRRMQCTSICIESNKEKHTLPPAPSVGSRIRISPPGYCGQYWGNVIASHPGVAIFVDFGASIGVNLVDPSQWRGAARTSIGANIPLPVGASIDVVPRGWTAKHRGRVVAHQPAVTLDVDFGGDIGLKVLEPSEWRGCMFSPEDPSPCERCACDEIAAVCEMSSAVKSSNSS